MVTRSRGHVSRACATTSRGYGRLVRHLLLTQTPTCDALIAWFRTLFLTATSVHADDLQRCHRPVPPPRCARRPRHPNVTAGRICEFAQAEAIFAAGEADLVASARQSLADPDWFLKLARRW
jgi:hypothetical protein